MPKMKSKGNVKKRFKETATGKLMHSCSNRSHILTKKSAKRKRHLRKEGSVAAVDVKRIRRMLVS